MFTLMHTAGLQQPLKQSNGIIQGQNRIGLYHHLNNTATHNMTKKIIGF